MWGAGADGEASRAGSPLRRPVRHAGRLAALFLLAIGGPGLRADDAALGAGGLGRGTFEAECPLFRTGESPSGSFGFGEDALGGSRAGWRTETAARFSLCAGLAGASVEERPEVRWSTREPRDPREPLRGVRNATAPHRKRLLRSSAILTGTAIASGVILSLLPREETNWEEGAFDHGFENLGRAWTSLPVWDRDEAFHDWFGHPYAGAFYYNMMRSQGATVGQSFAYSAAQSVVWEYVLEAAAEQPSIQDLISTPFIGAVVGELFHRWSVAILKKGRLNLGEKALVFFLNPSYVINNGYRAPE